MKHTYSAGGIIVDQHRKILLIDEGDGFWGFPKGRKEENEEAISTAVREIKEETGFDDLTLLAEVGTYQRHPVIDGETDESEMKHITLFLFLANSELLPNNYEGNSCAWFYTKEAARKLSDSADRDFFVNTMKAFTDTIDLWIM